MNTIIEKKSKKKVKAEVFCDIIKINSSALTKIKKHCQ